MYTKPQLSTNDAETERKIN